MSLKTKKYKLLSTLFVKGVLKNLAPKRFGGPIANQTFPSTIQFYSCTDREMNKRHKNSRKKPESD